MLMNSQLAATSYQLPAYKLQLPVTRIVVAIISYQATNVQSLVITYQLWTFMSFQLLVSVISYLLLSAYKLQLLVTRISLILSVNSCYYQSPSYQRPVTSYHLPVKIKNGNELLIIHYYLLVTVTSVQILFISY